jgi:hypothetical protein
MLPGCTAGARLFGAAVAAVEDVDGGGQPDLAIGEPAWTDSGRDRGQVWIVSMETGRKLRCIEPAEPCMGFGWSLAEVGDVDGDGHGDLAIGNLR